MLCLVLLSLAVSTIGPGEVATVQGTPPFKGSVDAWCVVGGMYEAKASYKAVTPAVVEVTVVKKVEGRGLLNVEKSAFTCEAPGEYTILISAEVEGVAARDTLIKDVVIKIKLDELLYGIPGGWETVKIVCIILTAVMVAVRVAPVVLQKLG